MNADSAESTSENIPQAIVRVREFGWWEPGTSILDIGCGNGAITAWLAESGFEATGIDADPEAIEHARREFGSVQNVHFESADLRQPISLQQQFLGAVDHGFFRGLGREERVAYATHLAAVTQPGARFLLILPNPPAGPKRVMPVIEQEFKPSFRLVDWKPTQSVDPATGASTRGLAVRLVRNPANAGERG